MRQHTTTTHDRFSTWLCHVQRKDLHELVNEFGSVPADDDLHRLVVRHDNLDK
jgi:hypothetical protein